MIKTLLLWAIFLSLINCSIETKESESNFENDSNSSFTMSSLNLDNLNPLTFKQDLTSLRLDIRDYSSDLLDKLDNLPLKNDTPRTHRTPRTVLTSHSPTSVSSLERGKLIGLSPRKTPLSVSVTPLSSSLQSPPPIMTLSPNSRSSRSSESPKSSSILSYPPLSPISPSTAKKRSMTLVSPSKPKSKSIPQSFSFSNFSSDGGFSEQPHALATIQEDPQTQNTQSQMIEEQTVQSMSLDGDNHMLLGALLVVSVNSRSQSDHASISSSS